MRATISYLIQSFDTSGVVLVCDVGLSFWGGVDPETGVIVDAHHPQCGASVAGRIVMMPSSRGSCTGSAVLLGLALAGKAPAALVFRESEDVLTLGAIVSNSMYGSTISVINLDNLHYDQLAEQSTASLSGRTLKAGDIAIELQMLDVNSLSLSVSDRHMLEGGDGPADKVAMETICTMALAQGAKSLIDITRVHIDGCIYASPANLTFAKTVMQMGGRVRVPTTMNAISVDYINWRKQGIAPDFGVPARDLADAYVAMGAEPSFTCAPYLRDDKPAQGELIAWAESNAVVYANSVLGARTNKHPDFLDLFIAMTGRVPDVGMYGESERRPTVILDVELPKGSDESVWPLLGWIAGQLASDRIPLLTGLANSQPDEDDLKALCAAFGTTSGAAMLHIDGITPEARDRINQPLPSKKIGRTAILAAWQQLNKTHQPIDLIALGSPHMSARECRQFATLMQGQSIAANVDVILTLGREILAYLEQDGTVGELEKMGVQLVPDVCWCSISRPLFPPNAKTVMTNSGKYAHYGPGLSGCAVLFGSLSDCAQAACTGLPPSAPPTWLDNAVYH